VWPGSLRSNVSKRSSRIRSCTRSPTPSPRLTRRLADVHVNTRRSCGFSTTRCCRSMGPLDVSRPNLRTRSCGATSAASCSADSLTTRADGFPALRCAVTTVSMDVRAGPRNPTCSTRCGRCIRTRPSTRHDNSASLIPMDRARGPTRPCLGCSTRTARSSRLYIERILRTSGLIRTPARFGPQGRSATAPSTSRAPARPHGARSGSMSPCDPRTSTVASSSTSTGCPPPAAKPKRR